ncbi:MobF family relaxase [Mucilaginibacter terrae]|uniref:MobF family relaxase n=1 Tax=Mucilaginibacter terrae TaxID=1955052 RepID=UPI003644C58E
MIRMIQSNSAGQAKSYFKDALSKADYYINDQELQGRFEGKLATRLGLEERATQEAFFALCENVNPGNGKPLTPRTKEERRIGYDINFHCPKSVSLVHALSKDQHILEAFESSVRETMQHIEADAKARVRKGKVYQDRTTGELVWASFTHQTARPVEGFAPDPHLHAHCFVFNATWDDTEQQYKAGQFGDIKRDMPYYQAKFHKVLSDKLHGFGYQVRRTEKSFEVVGVPQGAIDLFCKRTNEIGQIAKEKGIVDAKAKSELGARTRAAKQHGMSMSDLRSEWTRQIQENVIYNGNEERDTVRFAPIKEADKTLSADCIDYALKHSFERASVIQDRRLLETANRYSIGRHAVSSQAITDSFVSDTRFIKIQERGKILCTTKPVLQEESRMIALARAGQNRFTPLYTDMPVLNETLNAPQRAAVEHVLTTSSQVSIIRGAAGSGKTRLLQEAKRLMNEAGKTVYAVAPTAEASRGVLEKEGFAGAETVAKLLADKKMQEALKGQALFVDEAGLLGTQDMTALLALTQKQNARLILIGDTRQHASVVRGDALRILNTVGGIQAAEVSKILRQKNVHHRAAVEDLAKGDVGAAFIKLSSIGAIKNIDPLKPNDELVKDYMKLVKKGKNVLVVSPTHEQGNAVTEEIRSKLKASGHLGKRELKALKLTNTNLTQAEKSDWRKLQKGQLVQFNQNLPQIKRGSQWLIEESNADNILLKSPEGKVLPLPKHKASVFEVYEVTQLNLSKGDKVRITHNGFDKDDKRLNNGQSFDVVSVNKTGQIKLQNSISKSTYTLDKDFGHISHAYCTTSHSSQGKTVDEVLISQPSSTFTATDAKQFYVSVSRGSEGVTIYTDDRKALLEYASEMRQRQSATELVKRRKTHEDHVFELNKHPPMEIKPKEIDQNIDRNKDYEPRL